MQNKNAIDGDTAQHYLPDGMDKTTPGDSMKFGLMYTLSLSTLVKWYRSYEELPGKMKKPTTIYGYTNEAMHNFRTQLLGKEIYKEEGRYFNSYYYTLNLEKLSNDIVIMSRIDKMAQRCERMGYMTQYDVTKATI